MCTTLTLLGMMTSQEITPTTIVSIAPTMPLTQTINVTVYV